MVRPAFFPPSRLLWEMAFCTLVLARSIACGMDLTVQVTEAGSGAPIAGAVVSVTTPGVEKAISPELKSDNVGVCHVSIEANRAAILLDVKKSGWCPLRLDIPAQSAAPAGPLTFPMKRAGTLGGTIRDESGKPVAGAHVSVNFSQKLAGPHIPLDDLYANSDAQGKWETDFVPAETELLRIAVIHPDYSWDGSQPSREELAAKNAVSRMQSVLALSGRVVGLDGKPVAEATVVRRDQYGIQGLQSRNGTSTNAQGKFRFPPGTNDAIQVAAFAPGFGPVIKNVQVGRAAAPLDLGEIGDAKPQAKLFAPEPTRAEPVMAAMESSAESVAPGAKFEVRVQARIFSGFHIYGMDPKVSPFIPTALKLTLPDGLVADGDWKGPSPEHDKDGVEIYTGAAVFRKALKANATAAPKKYSLGVELEYEVCNNEMCYPPKKVELQATVEIAAARTP